MKPYPGKLHYLRWAKIMFYRNLRPISLGMCALSLLLVLFAGCRSESRSASTLSAYDPPLNTVNTNATNQPKMKLPPYKQINFSADGTPRRISGENLTAAFISVSEFQAAEKSRKHSEMIFFFMQYYHDFFKLADPRRMLKVEKIESDELGYTHVRLQQVVNRIPVWGKTILVHFNKENFIYLFQGDYLSGSALNGLPVDGVVTQSQAVEKAIKAASKVTSKWSLKSCSKVIFADQAQVPHLAYGITLSSGLIHRNLYFIDAASGSVLHKIDLTRQDRTRSPAEASQ